MRGWILNTIGIVLISLIFLLVVIGCFYLITKENTTVFFTASIVQDKAVNKEEQQLEKTVAFVGDIMLDRGVEYQIKQNNNDFFYPFAKIHEFLNEFDIVFGNLEGPIVENPPYFSDASLKFAFNKESAAALAKAGFNVLSLANNHTDNMLWAGIAQTRNFLSKNNISYVGEPYGCVQDFVLEKQGVLFLSFNKTYSNNCASDKIADAVMAVRKENPESFLIVSLHWGLEYQPTNSLEQQELAHKLVDAGADVIIGHHPHVAQNIELYNNKIIFYSLGNFVFDQYFSKETQEGLVVSLELYQDKLIYRLYPVLVGKAQPFLMEKAEKKEFLKELSKRSSEELFKEIRLGKIRIEKMSNKSFD